MLKQILPLFLSFFLISAANAQLLYKAKALYNTGLQLKEQQKLPEALTAFESSVSTYNKFDSAQFELGNMYLKLGKTPEAVSCFHSAIALSPDMTNALMMLGKVYRDYTQIYDSSIIYYKRAEATNDTIVEIYYSIAWNFNAKSEFDSAIVYGKKALNINNEYRPAYSELAHAYRRAQKYADAIEQFKKNLAISTIDLALLYSGYCYTELKDKEGATAMYEELKKVNEKMSTALKRVIDKM